MQIHKLEQKLAEIHATDVKALDRAHKSLCQHVDALQLESTVRLLMYNSYLKACCIRAERAKF